ncbi:acyl-homoserine-lactone synthase [uncultured Methylobacterium sp.]|uniref:acyl-homoserine-lactone synthase n=1 Tax=uncultured Methylobacterium sp. TaxID=157278 RepID=UPI0035CAFA75
MFRLITGDIDTDFPDFTDRIYRFRHGFFVDHLKWEACRKPDGRERDQFDGPGCVHVVGEEFEEIVAYARLLPTTRPHLVSHVYPEIMQGTPLPTGPRLYEWTRHAVAPRKREGRGAREFTKAHFAAVARAAEAVGIEALLVQTHPMLSDRVMDMGWDVEPLALPTTYDGGLVLPIIARLTPHTLATAQMALAAHGSELAVDGRRSPSPAPALPDRLVA